MTVIEHRDSVERAAEDWYDNHGAEFSKRVAHRVAFKEALNALVADYRGAIEALREIATRPTVERNPDGVDQAAWTMQLIAREALDQFSDGR